MKNLRGILIMALMAAGLMCSLQGCLFEPREAQDPGSGGEDTWIDPEVPKDIFQNLSSGLSEGGNSNYERSLSEEFAFIPRDVDAGQYPAVFGSVWGKEREMAMLDKLKSDYAVKREIRFGNEAGEFNEEVAEGASPWFQGEYLITVDSGSGEEYFGGIAKFTLEASSQGGWVLVEWEDLDVLEAYSTAGLLRGALGSGGE